MPRVVITRKIMETIVIRAPGHQPIRVVNLGHKTKLAVEAEPDIEINREEVDRRKHPPVDLKIAG